MPIYDVIGQSYSKSRLPDLRIVDCLLNLLALETGSIVADIGAGTGGYSRAIADRGFLVYAVEPSQVMRKQAISHTQVQWLAGYAEAIPLSDSSVDAAFSILAMHHFSDLESALKEINRVTKKNGAIVFLTFDPRVDKNFWLYDYFPFIREYDERFFPPLENIVTLIEQFTQRIVKVSTLMLPPNLSDMFLAAAWRQPEIYLNSDIRAGMSAFTLAESSVVEKGVKLLEADLNSGEWDAKYGEIRQLKEIDVGYRFLWASVAN
jgi:ubiquinone/menaquinone biosynthesis C-methylase UbiE